MLRAEIRDLAVSVAKAWGHAEVEPRHVLFALAKRFRDQPGVGALYDAARAALEPRGSSVEVPALRADAVALLERLGSEADALAVLEADVGTGGPAPGAPAAGEGAGGGVDEGDRAAREAGRTAQAPAPDAAAAETAEADEAGEAGEAGETVADVLAELDALVGLDPVKERVRDVIAVVQANLEREKAGLAPVNPSLHLVFTGPPGTGKTTVARLMARLYAATGALAGSRFTEAGRADLIAGYVGQTAMKTQDVINRSRPGVLFIDEAYALTPTSDLDFGREAIATIVKAMEDYRGELAVIVAGYEDEMAEFVGSNPGLRSRFKTYIAFPDYSPDELTEIFAGFAHDTGIRLADGVREKARAIFARNAGRQDFGNARFARSLFEQAYANMAARAAEDGTVTVDELVTLTPEDVDMEVDDLIKEKRRIGF
jgi:SpoVK/Ycf46/Vps4 family AAA+-type ATPase